MNVTVQGSRECKYCRRKFPQCSAALECLVLAVLRLGFKSPWQHILLQTASTCWCNAFFFFLFFLHFPPVFLQCFLWFCTFLPTVQKLACELKMIHWCERWVFGLHLSMQWIGKSSQVSPCLMGGHLTPRVIRVSSQSSPV